MPVRQQLQCARGRRRGGDNRCRNTVATKSPRGCGSQLGRNKVANASRTWSCTGSQQGRDGQHGRNKFATRLLRGRPQQSCNKFDLIAKSELGEDVVASPSVANGRLYIRGEKHLFCYGTK